ncbi:hypothetical protein ACFULT_22000 [Rhodococcus sp. NPDC057297]|uniref:hypothetical protein n=1 Tax=Rhodococcus sp. NPDC057297 TaxID=3346090 RepID=UPI003637CA9B
MNNTGTPTTDTPDVPAPTAPRLRIEALTAAKWWCLKTSVALWREHTAPPSRFAFTPQQLGRTVFVFGGGTHRAPALGERR